MKIDLQPQATLLRPSKKLFKGNKKNIMIISDRRKPVSIYYINCWIRRVKKNIILNVFMKNIRLNMHGSINWIQIFVQQLMVYKS